MKTVTFSREYRHPLPGHREAVYPPNVEIEVTNEVAAAAQKARAVKEEEAPDDGERSAEGN